MTGKKRGTMAVAGLILLVTGVPAAQAQTAAPPPPAPAAGADDYPPPEEAQAAPDVAPIAVTSLATGSALPALECRRSTDWVIREETTPARSRRARASWAGVGERAAIVRAVG